MAYTPRSRELKTRSCNGLSSGLYRATFSVLSPSGKPNSVHHFQSWGELFGAQQQGISAIKLFTLVKTTTLNCTHKQPENQKWCTEVSSLYHPVFNSVDSGICLPGWLSDTGSFLGCFSFMASQSCMISEDFSRIPSSCLSCVSAVSCSATCRH